MSSSSGMRMTHKGGYVGVCAVFALMALTIYMAFAFPFTIFQLKQTETTEIKSVIIIGRGGEKSPTPDSYFMGEEPPEELKTVGYEQLINVGKERMFLLGKFLKLRYYNLLLNGNPRMLKVRSVDLDRTLESAQALLAGLNPPKDRWFWSSSSSSSMNDLNQNWQPKAIHTTSLESDDLLSINPPCQRFNRDRMKWKNSTRYQQLLNEFRHDLQTLRSNTGLEFEDDLEILSQIEDSLRTRLAFKADVPAWYTPTFAQRLAHIADVTTGSRYSSPDIQRLYVGRLLNEIVENVNSRIRLDQEFLAAAESKEADGSNNNEGNILRELVSPLIGKTKCILDEPKVFVYMTDKQRMSALLNSLQIYQSQPLFGSMLLIELHYDPLNQLYFLRLFTISSTSPNVFPEPLRVNPIACADSAECSPQQFEQNIRHLMIEQSDWQEACRPKLEILTTPQPPTPEPEIKVIDDNSSSTVPLREDKKSPIVSTTQMSLISAPDETSSSSTTNSLDKVDENLLVAPTSVQTESSAELKPETVTKPAPISVESSTIPTEVSSQVSEVENDLEHGKKDDNNDNNNGLSESNSTSSSNEISPSKFLWDPRGIF